MDYKVKDLNLAEAGRHQIRLAESEMPGLMAIREQYGEAKPLRGARITGSLHMTVQTAVLIETLVALGAEVRWASCNIFSTQDEAAAAVVVGKGTVSNPAGVPVFAWKGETLEEYWWCTERILDWSSHPAAEGKTYFGPNMILDDGGDVTLLVHKGVEYETKGSVPSAAAGDSEEWQVVLELLKNLQQSQRGRFSAISKEIIGVSEETTTGVKRLYDFAQAGTLLFPAVNVNDSATKSLFDNRIGTRESGLDAWKFGTAAQIAGKTVFVAGYGDVGKGVAAGFRGQGARVVVSEIDPICAIQAAMEGYQVVTIEDVLADADVFITTTGNTDIVTAEHIQQMKDKAVIFNVGHFDNEIQMAEIGQIAGIKRTEIKPQVHEWILPSGKSVIILSEGRLANLGNATGHPSFVMSMSFTNQVLAQLALWNREFSLGVHILPKHLDEQVARLHLPHINAKLTMLTSKQAEYLGVDVNGPYKPNHYRY